MTSTVVGAALIAAIAVACEHIGHENEGKEPTREHLRVKLNKKALKPFRPLDLAVTLPATTSSLVERAQQTVSLCFCEGQDRVTNHRIRACQKCYHTTCEDCGGNPEHYYGPYGEGYQKPRLHPRLFESEIKKALPMRIRLTNIDTKSLASVQTMDHDDIWSNILSDLNDSGASDLRFQSIVRNHKWTLSWSSLYYRMDLSLFRGKATWFLYALPDPSEPAASHKRKSLMPPIARMEPQDHNILLGLWHFRVPPTSTPKVKIIGRGKSVPAWEAKLGLPESHWADMTLYEELSITLVEPVSDQWFEDEISGQYELLADCDTANHSLYKRRSVDEQAEPLFFFFDPHRYGNSDHDYFVFAREKCRLDYKEHRHILARLSKKWRPTALSDELVDCFVDSRWVPVAADLEPFIGTGKPEFAAIKPTFSPNVAFGIVPSAEEAKVAAKALVLQPDEPAEETGFHPYVFSGPDTEDRRCICITCEEAEEEEQAAHARAKAAEALAIKDEEGIKDHEAITSSAIEAKKWIRCAEATLSVLHCNIIVDQGSFRKLEGAGWTTVQPPDYHATLSELSFASNRIGKLDGFPDGWWPLALPTRIRKCPTCAPKYPDFKWQSKRLGAKSWRIIPYEDEYQANRFEEQMRRRPDTTVLQICKGNDHVVNLRIGINVAALAHQALANLQSFDNSSESTLDFCTAQWRLDAHYQHHRNPFLPLYKLRHNRSDCRSDHLFLRQLKQSDGCTELDLSLQLRPEQTRSLQWMLNQESLFTPPFLRQES